MGITSNYWFATGFTGCQLYVNAVQKYVFEGTLFRPATDNAIACGNGSFRWTTVFAVTGTINTSDVRQKTDIAPETLGLNFITKLNPVSYRWIEGQRIAIDPEPKYDAETGQRIAQEATEVEVRPGERTFHGLLAQEVKSTLDEMGVEDFAGWTLDDKNDPDSRQGLRYTEFIAPLIKAVQELSAQNKALESRVAALELAQ
jgi:hypothetical protein